ncbi:SDR family oxidoreductase [Rhodococcus triatomae]|uniref:NAD(P)-dependent dehydrogenase, short-chain alcohol dehydrogenase family n=1 Tax=Rhodococcus triatomae TaxID=300028 RepID=A0A1G7ZUN9_9NOCA|nr:SDR family oxidoreductase [Rhodococcus triatomae]QNG17942.1 SDR family oxidoreductase [Rhodococcus triatomae]QNG22389.1 SDR family oxidoreductase [Rhodococcus triatomae]SDH12374.1 NAD(P)-dependent dehydrogenase, short-chain alcohol dehydrogenase family [Rhodococcus triatomae]
MSVVFSPGPLLDGRRAVVTGGAAGIGAAVAGAFAAHGATVLIVDVADAAVPEGPGHESWVADVREGSTAQSIADWSPDVLVNNVGHFLRPPARFAETETNHWAELADVNFEHVLRVTRAVLPGMAGRGGGSIVNLTTVEAHRAIPGHTVYSAYKAALVQFTRSLGVEEGPNGVRVNAIAPDLIETDQVPYRDLVADSDWDTWPFWAPLGGPGRAEDVAGAALYLASELSRYVTGTTVHVDGGSHAAGGWFRRGEGGWTNRPRNA